VEHGSAKRLHWSLAASVAAHAVLLASLPSVRLAVSQAATVKPMRVVRAYHAAVVPPQLVAAPVRALEARAARVESPARSRSLPPTVRSTPDRPAARQGGGSSAPKPKMSSAPPASPAAPTPKPSPADPGGSSAPVSRPSKPVRQGPPERLALGPASPHPIPAGGLILSEPGPAPGGAVGDGAGGGTGSTTGAGGTGTGSGSGAGEGSGSGTGTGAGAAGDGTGAGGSGHGEGGGSGAGGAGEGDGAGGGGAPTVSPSALSLAKPAYPEVCRRRSQEGTVGLRVLVLRDGSVSRAEVARSSGIAAFDRAAREGARNWRFRPAMRGHTPLDAWVALSVVFRLEDAYR